MDTSDLLLDKTQEFTETEIMCLTRWLDQVQKGNVGTAARLLSTGLLLEHYRSLLSEDPGQITDGQKTQLATLQKAFDDASRAGGYG